MFGTREKSPRGTYFLFCSLAIKAYGARALFFGQASNRIKNGKIWSVNFRGQVSNQIKRGKI